MMGNSSNSRGTSLAAPVRRPTGALFALLAVACVGCDEPRYEPVPAMPPDDGGPPGAEGGSARPAELPDGGGEAGATDSGGGATNPNDSAPPSTKPRPSDAAIASDAAPPIDAAPPSDGATPGDGATTDGDARTPPTTLPLWAAGLVGRYAVQAFMFGQNEVNITAIKLRMLADIERHGDRLTLRTQLCDSRSTSNIGAITVDKPESLPPRAHEVMLGEGWFTAQPVDLSQGYQKTAMPGCPPGGGTGPAQPMQGWLTDGICVCGPEVPPLQSDCRVVDPDGDELPGYTLSLKAAPGSLFRDAKLWGVSADSSRFVRIEPGADGTLLGGYDGQLTTRHFGSNPRLSTEFTETILTCDTELATAEFTPLSAHTEPVGGWSCENVRAHAHELFKIRDRALPMACKRAR